MVVVVMPIICMEKGRVVKFFGDIHDVPIKESNLQLMKAWNNHYKNHKNVVDKGGTIPMFANVSARALWLVNNALNVRPDQFADYYNRLPSDNRTCLIKVSGQYNDAGKKVMLDIPEITKRLIDVCFEAKDVCNHIKSYLRNEDEDYVRNFFKEQLINSKRLLSLKQPTFNGTIRDRLCENIYLGSVFLDAGHTIHPYDYSVSLHTGDKVRKTYAICFGIDNYEYRITDVRDNQCLLWVINHNNPDATFSTLIKHKENIKGCCFSSTKTDVEGVLTYSDFGMVFSTITTQNGLSCVESISVKSPHQIVDACFSPVIGSDFGNDWMVGSYEGLESVTRRWSMQGEFKRKGHSLPFKHYGLLEKMAIYQTGSDYCLAEIYGVANLYSTMISKPLSNGLYQLVESTPLESVGDHNLTYYTKIIKVGDSIAMYNLNYPFFGEKDEGNFWSQPENKVHRVYSPEGSFLMSNSLKKKLGILYVETVIQDAVTHKQILSIDSLYAGFSGVGFTHDETELIFLNAVGPHYKVSLLNYEDKQVLSQIEDIACAHLGVASLVKRLCMECRKKGSLSLREDDSTYTMLIDWSRKSPALLELLKKCLPITKIKK